MDGNVINACSWMFVKTVDNLKFVFIKYNVQWRRRNIIFKIVILLNHRCNKYLQICPDLMWWVNFCWIDYIILIEIINYSFFVFFIYYSYIRIKMHYIHISFKIFILHIFFVNETKFCKHFIKLYVILVRDSKLQYVV